jgi:hypothetical protein
MEKVDRELGALREVMAALSAIESDGEQCRVLLYAVLKYAPEALADRELWALIERAKKP